MIRAALVWSAAALAACKGDQPASGPPAGSGAAPPGVGDAAAARADLPRSADVLAKDEASPNSRVVIASDFRYQIPDGFAPVAIGGTTGYTGTVDGTLSPGTVTLWATSEPFAGDLEALVARETAAATTAGGKPPDVGPVMIVVADRVAQGVARRMTTQFPDRIELRTLAVHAGTAFVHHCATPNVTSAWANLSVTCLARGTTFHVAPPPLRPLPPPAQPFANRPPPPDTPNVLFFMSSYPPGARDQRPELKAWSQAIGGYVKPCLRDLHRQSAEVTIELAEDGTVIGSGAALLDATGSGRLPAPDAVVTCVAEAVAGAAMAGTAKDKITIEILFSIQ